MAALVLPAAVIALLLLSPNSASAGGRNLHVGFVADQFGDDLLTNQNPKIAGKWFNRLKGTNASILRINVYWNQSVGGSPPAQPRNPKDPSYVFSRTDAAVKNAVKRHITPVLTVVGAPRWAEGKNPPPESEYRVGSWKPDGKKLSDFAAALAKRYSGHYKDGGKLPRVKYFEAWNEGNIPQYLAPQWKGHKPVSPIYYRKLLNGFYKGVHMVRGNQVILGGTSPFGDKPGGVRMKPYFFWREVMCLKHNLKPDKKCAKGGARAHFDIYSHHPINAKKGLGPTSKSPDPDDGVPSNFGQLGKIVRAAEKHHTILPQKKGRPGWATETWYESKPPEKKAVSLATQARFMEQDLYVLWKQGADAVFFLQLRDDPYDPSQVPLVGFQTGIYFINSKPKPSLQAVQFPFVASRKSKRTIEVWGIAPKSGKLTVSNKGKGPGKLGSFKVHSGKVFVKRLRFSGGGKHKLRAKVGGKSSLPWVQK